MRGAIIVLAGLALIGAGLTVGGGASAQDASKAAYEKRSATMKRLGDAMKHMNGVVKGEAQYGPDTVKAAETVQSISKDLAGLFPAGSAVGESRAKPNIWTDWDNFKKKADAMRDPADKLIPAVKAGQTGMGPAVSAVGGTCKGCHDDYQKPKT
jgi:cytochrome c556